MNCLSSDMDLITDMFDTNYDDKIDSDQSIEYYIGKAEYILKQFDNIEHFYYFLMTLMKKYPDLSIDQKKEIVKMLDVKPEEKIIYRERVTKGKNKKSKPKLNTYDDY